ncbi:MAG: glycoside hydrolase [Chloroflexi bacterium]|nr:glycoside hydrolase [Chloroflexota bacterium]
MPATTGAFFSGEYRNMFGEWGKTDEEIQARIDETWNQLFYGDDHTERVYYPVGDDMAYLLDTGNNDVRTEGQSYGMMIAVQLDKKQEFDRIWKWTKTYMYNQSGAYQGYFAWHCQPDGSKIDENPASDGEIWFATALFFAAGRWGNGEGIFDYQAEANAILHTMLHQEDDPKNGSKNMFDGEHKQVVFVPSYGQESSYTDPSYHVPHYYDLWALWADEDNVFWAEAAAASREFLKSAAHPETGLMANYTEFDGRPKVRGDYGEFFYSDAWRVPMNVAVDYAWFAADEWEIEQSNRIQAFFYTQGLYSYSDKWRVDGSESLTPWHSEGLVATNAVASLAASESIAWEFIEEFWNTSIPTGQWRYYSGLLYMMSLLHLSGEFRIYEPS